MPEVAAPWVGRLLLDPDTHVLMVSSTAYDIKFDGFSPTFFNQFLVVFITFLGT
jgi:hypothetical protein